MNDTPDLTARLQKLERQLRRLRIAFLGMLVIVIASCLTLAIMQRRHGLKLSVREIAFRDAAGTVRAFITADARKPRLAFTDESGKNSVLEVGLTDRRPYVGFYDAHSPRMISLLGADGPTLRFWDDAGQQRVLLGMTPLKDKPAIPGLILRDDQARERLRATVWELGPVIEMRNEHGKNPLEIWAYDKSRGMQLRDDAGEVRSYWLQWNTVTTFGMKQPDGGDRLSLVSGRSSTTLTLRDRGGAPRVALAVDLREATMRLKDTAARLRLELNDGEEFFKAIGPNGEDLTAP